MEELEHLQEQIQTMEAELKDLRKEYHEKKLAGLRSAIQARQEADKLIQEELRSIGYKQFNNVPINMWRNLAQS